MVAAATSRAFLWDSLPNGIQLADVLLAIVLVIYAIGVWHSWATPTSTDSAASIPIENAPAGEVKHHAGEQTEAERAAAAADRAVAAADRAVSAAERAVAVSGAGSAEERAMAASSVGSFVTLGIAAAAVLLTGAGVLLGVEAGATQLTRSVFTELLLATGWLVASLIFGAISASYVINHIHHTGSVAENRLVVFFSAVQLAALVAGAVYFMLSITLF